jgi:AcrR family transcriptional regulator
MNSYGNDITLSFLASQMKVTIGQITYHFANKDQLIIGIAEEYQANLSKLVASYSERLQHLDNYESFVSDLLDQQFEYRCAIRYIFGSSRQHVELFTHVDDYSDRSLNTVKSRIITYVQNGDLHDDILEKEHFGTFLFQYLCLLNGWLGYYEIYGGGKSYEDLKPLYLKGIFKLFLPYTTPSGKEKLKCLNTFIE